MRPEDDPRMKIMDAIEEKNEAADAEYHNYHERGMEEAERALEESEDAKYEQEMDEDWERGENYIEPEEAVDRFQEEYADLLEDGLTRQRLINALTIAEAEGADDHDWRTYKAVGDRYRQRAKKIESRTLDEVTDNRETVFEELEAAELREIKLQGAQVQEKPANPEEVRARFADEFFEGDLEQDKQTLTDAGAEVDRQHRDQYIRQGYVDNSFETYRKAGEHAERERYLDEREQ